MVSGANKTLSKTNKRENQRSYLLNERKLQNNNITKQIRQKKNNNMELNCIRCTESLLFWNGYNLCYTHPMKLIIEHRMPAMCTNNIGLHSYFNRSQCSKERDVRRANVRMLFDWVLSTYSKLLEDSASVGVRVRVRVYSATVYHFQSLIITYLLIFIET